MADAKKRVEIDVRTTGAQQAEADLKRIGQTGDQGLRAIVGGAQSADAALRLLGPVLARISAAAAAAAAALAFRQIIRAGDELTGSLARLGSATGNVTTAAEVYDRLYQSSLRTGASVSDSIAAFTRFSVAAKDIGATNDQVLKLIEGIQGFARIAGTSSEALGAATLQLGQALASGTLQGDELRSILEAMPELAQALAGELRMSVGELRKAGAEGRLTADQVFPALLRAAEGVQRQLAGLPVTLEQGAGALTSAMERFLGQLDQAIGGSRRLAEGLKAAGTALDATRQALLGPGSQDERFAANNDRIAALVRRRETLNDRRNETQGNLDAAIESFVPRSASPERQAQARAIAERDPQVIALRRTLDAQLAELRRYDDQVNQLQLEQDDIQRDRTARNLSDQAEAARRAREQQKTAAQAAYAQLQEQTNRELALRKEFAERSAVLQRARASGVISEEQFIADSVRLQAQLQQDLAKLTEGARRATAATAESGSALAKALERLKEQQLDQLVSDAGRIFEATRTPAEQYAATINRLNEILRAGKLDQDTYNRAVKQAKDTLENADEDARKLKDAANELGLTFTSAFEEAAIRGKRLRDVLAGLAQDIARIILRQTVTKPLAEAATGLLTKIGGELGGFFGGGGGSKGGGSAPATPAAPSAPAGGFLTFGGPRAAGGPVAGGTGYLVGERGPELFVPDAPGTIMPAGRFSAGGVTVNQTFAIDARGADAGSEARMRAMVPQIVAAARDATLDAIRRGGYAYRTARG
jgi:tape measure domain-containing protein